MPRQTRFRTLLLEALRYFQEHGYRSEADLQEWLLRLGGALELELPSDAATRAEIAVALERVFKREVDRGGVLRRVPGAERYTIDRVAPALRAELDRRIFASADLIKLNKTAATQRTLQRFSGWISSMPAGSRSTGNLRAAATEILKPTAQLKYERRRLAIDQGHKLSSAIAYVVAQGSGAIAGIWHDRGQYDRGYDARPDHLARSGTMFLIRDSWALTEGLVKKGKLGYTDEIEQPAELVYCSCWYEYVTSPRDLPAELLTAKGRAWVDGRGWVAGIRPRTDSRPTPAQIKAGNYSKGHRTVAGLKISVETPRNGLRYGTGPDGNEWLVAMPADYGYIRRTNGADGEQLDCYVGPDPSAPVVWIVEQADLATGRFDEHKVMLGFGSREEAISTYTLGFSDGMGPARIRDVLELQIADFTSWLPFSAKPIAEWTPTAPVAVPE